MEKIDIEALAQQRLTPANAVLMLRAIRQMVDDAAVDEADLIVSKLAYFLGLLFDLPTPPPAEDELDVPADVMGAALATAACMGKVLQSIEVDENVMRIRMGDGAPLVVRAVGHWDRPILAVGAK